MSPCWCQHNELTCVHSNAQLQLVRRPVSDREAADCRQQSQRHARYFSRVWRSVAHRQAGHHHVGVSYRLHLPPSALQAERTNKNILVTQSGSKWSLCRGKSECRDYSKMALTKMGVAGERNQWIRCWTIWLHKRQISCRTAERLSAYQEGLLFAELVSLLHVQPR